MAEKGQHCLYADFLQGPLGYRRQHGAGLKQAIAVAVGLKNRNQKLSILDVTAGLGRDAFILATMGCHVHLIERSPVIAELLLDGLERARKDPAVAPIIHNMKVLIMDAMTFLRNLKETELPDIIYLDPMFPERGKSALNKIEMRIIREIVGDDLDAEALFVLALTKAKKRVVVKRPKLAPPLSNYPPNFVVKGKSNRYDVYTLH